MPLPGASRDMGDREAVQNPDELQIFGTLQGLTPQKLFSINTTHFRNWKEEGIL